MGSGCGMGACAFTSLTSFLPQCPQFFKDLDGSYVANVRLFDPNVIDMAPTNGRAVAQVRQ